MSQNRNLIKALEQFRKAYLDLLEEWSENYILDDLESIELYPFHKSFDELDVCRWVEETLDEIEYN